MELTVLESYETDGTGIVRRNDHKVKNDLR